MAANCFHPSIEGAQHGAKSLPQFLDYAKKSGAAGAQPSNYMLQTEKGFLSAKEIKAAFSKAKRAAFFIHDQRVCFGRADVSAEIVGHGICSALPYFQNWGRCSRWVSSMSSRTACT